MNYPIPIKVIPTTKHNTELFLQTHPELADAIFYGKVEQSKFNLPPATHQKEITDQEIDLTLKHLALYAHLKQQSQSYTLVIEDRVILRPDYRAYLDKLLINISILPYIDVLPLTHNNVSYTTESFGQMPQEKLEQIYNFYPQFPIELILENANYPQKVKIYPLKTYVSIPGSAAYLIKNSFLDTILNKPCNWVAGDFGNFCGLNQIYITDNLIAVNHPTAEAYANKNYSYTYEINEHGELIAELAASNCNIALEIALLKSKQPSK